jgi:muramoyltetrapeptide carboxypeptidase
VLGSWAECGPYDAVRELFVDRLGPLGVPVVEEFGFGHCASTLTMPLDVPAVLDAPPPGDPSAAGPVLSMGVPALA